MTPAERGMLRWIDDATSLLRTMRPHTPNWRRRIDSLLRRQDGALVLGSGGRAPLTFNGSDRRRRGGIKEGR